MHIANVTNDYDNITSSDYDNTTSSYDNMTLSICTFNENDVDLNIPALLLTVPCGISFFCLMSLMVYTLIKPLFNKRNIYQI